LLLERDGNYDQWKRGSSPTCPVTPVARGLHRRDRHPPAVASASTGLSRRVTEQRERAKMSPTASPMHGGLRLSRRLNAPVEEAQEIMDRYFRAFPEVRDYMEGTVAEARSRGYTPHAARPEAPAARAERLELPGPPGSRAPAMNAGSRARGDLFKWRWSARRALESAGLASRLVLQVHDEVIVDVPEVKRPPSGP